MSMQLTSSGGLNAEFLELLTLSSEDESPPTAFLTAVSCLFCIPAGRELMKAAASLCIMLSLSGTIVCRHAIREKSNIFIVYLFVS